MAKNIVVAATGASGLPLLVECLKIIKENENFKSYLIMSESAKLTLAHETEYSLEDVYQYADFILEPKDIGAGPAIVFILHGTINIPSVLNEPLAGHSPISFGSNMKSAYW